MGDLFARACNAIAYGSDDTRKKYAKRIYVVVDGRNEEFQKELERLGLSRLKEWFHLKDHRTDCYLRFFKVRPEESERFQQAALDLAAHMPELGYPDYTDYALKTLVEYDCIPAEEALEQTGIACEAPKDPGRAPDALFNVAGLRTDFPKSLFWTDVMVIEGSGQEGQRLLAQRGFEGMKVYEAVSHRDWPRYTLFTCAVPKKRWEEFADVMHDLEKRMLVLGYRDYEEACAAIIRLAKEQGEEES